MSFARVGHCVLVLVCLLACSTAQAQPTDRALAFTDSGYVDLGDPGDVFDFAPHGGRTFALWMRRSVDRELYHSKLLDKRGDSRQPGYTIFLHQYTGTVGIRFNPPFRYDPQKGGKGYLIVGTAGTRPVSDNRWHHVAIVQADTLLRVYVDGHLDIDFAIPYDVERLVSDSPAWLGWNGVGAIRFIGNMDEISIWSRALSRREIRRLMYTSPTPGAPDLTAYWPGDSDDPTRLVDVSGNGHHGQLIHTHRTAATRPLGPSFRETIWFYVVVGLAALLALAALNWLLAMGLRARNRQLESLVAERTQQVEEQASRLADQAEDLKSLSAAKSRFFANVSHEFRTPLTLSLGLIGDLVRQERGALHPGQVSDLEQVRRQNMLLLRQVNQLLDMARVEAHQLALTVRPLDLADQTRALAQAFAGHAERHGLAFDQHLPSALSAWTDADQFVLVVTNLLSNAFKFTQQGGRVALSLEHEGDWALIQVADTGQGIQPEHLSHIFERFYQADESHQRIGSGIGLAMVKEVIDLLGGTIAVQSEPDQGTTFSVRLPIARAHYESLDHATLVDEPLEQPREQVQLADDVRETAPVQRDDADEDLPSVLIVDDNAEIRAFVRRHLAPHFHTYEAADGVEALQAARDRTPDVIVSDVMMPRMDGFGLVEAIRADSDLDFVPIILLTARVEAEDRLGGLERGADDYVTKPFEPDELVLRVRNTIRSQHRLRDRLRKEGSLVLLAAEALPRPNESEQVKEQPEPTVFLERVSAAIRARMSEEGFSVDALADELLVGRTHLYRRVLEESGMSPSAFIREVRLERAAELLGERAGSVGEIAYAVGFESTSYFGKRFKERFGVPPSRYTAAA